MKPKDIAKLTPEDKQEYESSLKIQNTPDRYEVDILNFVNVLEQITAF